MENIGQYSQCDQKIEKKIRLVFGKSSQKSSQKLKLINFNQKSSRKFRQLLFS
jgi:hypothetical protein